MSETKEQTQPKVDKPAKSAAEAAKTEQPDATAQAVAEATRQAQVKGSVAVQTGDDSAVMPQPDREAPGVPSNFAPIVQGERQASEQPDRYAVGDEAAEYAVEPNGKNGRRGAPRKKKEEAVEAPTWPAQYDLQASDVHPAQYSW